MICEQGSSRTVYFGRDPLGRRSLVVHRPTPAKPYLTLASMSNGSHDFEELPADTLFSVSLDDHCLNIQNVSRESAYLQLIAPKPLHRDLPAADYPIPVDPLPPIWGETVEEFIKHLDASIVLRTQDIPRLNSLKNSDARVAVLFSGGIDCSVIAFLAHRHLPLSEPIDLLNVAFENPHRAEGHTQPSQKKPHKQSTRPHLSEEQKYSVPDRITGLEQVEEFRRLAPERTWNFVTINIPYEETLRHRPIIERLMAPSRTVMDMSLALALYFASRGIGCIESRDTEAPNSPTGSVRSYTSPARVILSGLGADELLGGYIRHRNAYKHGGWQALLDELQRDVDRIHIRNLGRDDRVISSHGKEARYPFLSMNLLAYLSSIPIHLKVDPRVIPPSQTPQDEANEQLAVKGLPGDKLLLRLAARRLGLHGAASRAKRAMQFGSRSARLEGGDVTKRSNGATLLS